MDKILFVVIKMMAYLVVLGEKTKLIYAFPFLYKWHHQMLQCYLREELKDVVDRYKVCDKESIIEKKNNCFIFWYQGFSELPSVVKKCIDKIQETNPHLNFYFLSQENIDDYCGDLSEDVKRKFSEKKISIQHYSDIIRVYLLSKYGGFWIDATLFVTQKFPDEIYEYSFYSVKSSIPNNSNISKRRWAIYFMYSVPDNILMNFIYECLCEYFKNNDKTIDYFLTDHIINLGYKNVPIIEKLIDSVPINNEGVFSYKNVFDFNRFKSSTYVYKLNWRSPLLGLLS